MNSNIIPKARTPVINLAYLALAGAQLHGPAIRLLHNTAALIEADLFRVTGDPDAPGVPGSQARLDAQLRAMNSAQAELDAALKAARDFCHMGIGILKPILGHRWNGNWLTAGFTSKRVAVPRVPLALLVEFRSYLTVNPDRASNSLHFTAADAQAHVETVQAAMQVRDTARGARWSVKAGRDDAFRQLRKRLSALRAELVQLISPMDDRWYAFGFRRPADGKKPNPVKQVALTPCGGGIVLVNWSFASLAENYRVTWRLRDSVDEPTQVGLFVDRQCYIIGLPMGVSIVVRVSARNDSGETAPTEATIVVG